MSLVLSSGAMLCDQWYERVYHPAIPLASALIPAFGFSLRDVAIMVSRG